MTAVAVPMNRTALPSIMVDLIGRVDRREEHIRYHGGAVLQLAKEQGEDLVKLREWAKDQPGGFKAAVALTTISRAMAYRYIQVAENWDAACLTPLDTSLRSFLGITARERERKALLQSPPPVADCNAETSSEAATRLQRADSDSPPEQVADPAAEGEEHAWAAMLLHAWSNVPPQVRQAIAALREVKTAHDRKLIDIWMDFQWKRAFLPDREKLLDWYRRQATSETPKRKPTKPDLRVVA